MYEITTGQEWVEDARVRFPVRVVHSLTRKDAVLRGTAISAS